MTAILSRRSTLAKIERIRGMIDGINPACDLEVDGRIDAETASLAVEAGANVLVAGSAIFNDREDEAIERLRGSISAVQTTSDG